MDKKKKRLVIRTIILVLLAAAVGYSLYSNLTAEKRGNLAVGDKAPNFELYDLEGNKHKLSDYEGKGVFLNFWGTWCKPCEQEMPHMNKLYQEYKGQGVEILAVNVGESDFLINKFMNKHDLTFPVVVDVNDDVQRAYNIVPLPTTFLIDSDGTIQKIVQKTMSEEDVKANMELIKP